MADSDDSAPDDPAVLKAQAIVDQLSADPHLRRLVWLRERDLATRRIEMSAAYFEGFEKGRREGLLTTAILDLCEAYGIAPTVEQRAELERLDGPGLDALRARLKQDRRWA